MQEDDDLKILVSVSVKEDDPKIYDLSWEDIKNLDDIKFSNLSVDVDKQKESPSSPERMLMIAVFIQALLDATKPEYKGEPLKAQDNRRSAHKWFSVPACVTASTFEPICEMAGIDPSYARKYYNKILDGEMEFPYRRINVLINATKD